MFAYQFFNSIISKVLLEVSRHLLSSDHNSPSSCSSSCSMYRVLLSNTVQEVGVGVGGADHIHNNAPVKSLSYTTLASVHMADKQHQDNRVNKTLVYYTTQYC